MKPNTTLSGQPFTPDRWIPLYATLAALEGLIVQQEAAAELAALRAQRDDLLAAMKAVIEMVDYAVEAHAHVSDTCITMQKARAAIARATEEA